MKDQTHRCFRFCLCVMALSLCNEAFAALITPLAQDRSVRATANAVVASESDFDDQSNAAIDFGPFHSLVEASALMVDPVNGAQADAYSFALQGSDILDHSISVGLSVSAYTSVSVDQYGLSVADGYTSFDLTFWLSEPAEYVLTGTHTSLSPYPGSTAIFLERLGDVVVFQQQEVPYNSAPFDQTGVLPVGQYRLLAYAGASAESGVDFNFDNVSSDFSFELTLVPVPLPAAGWLFICGLLGLVGIARRGSVLPR